MTNSARLYGSSLYDLAVEEGCVDEMQDALSQVRGIFRENPGYLHLLAEPSLPLAERQHLVEEALLAGSGSPEKPSDAEHYLINFIKLLCERRILGDFYGCCDEYVRRYRIDRNIVQAVVYSALPLTAAQEEALKGKLEIMSGKHVLMDVRTDPDVIGGLKVELDGKELDGSVRGRLSGISRKLSEASL